MNIIAARIKGVFDEGQGTPVFDDGQGDHHDTPSHNTSKELGLCLAFLEQLHLVHDDDDVNADNDNKNDMDVDDDNENE